MSSSFRRKSDLKIGPVCALYPTLAIILSDFFEVCINGYWCYPKPKYHMLTAKVLGYYIKLLRCRQVSNVLIY